LRPERAIRGADSRKVRGLKSFTNVNLLDEFSRHSEVVEQRLFIGYPDPEKKGEDASTECQNITYKNNRKKKHTSKEPSCVFANRLQELFGVFKDLAGELLSSCESILGFFML
jgi:hypothetical protein